MVVDCLLFLFWEMYCGASPFFFRREMNVMPQREINLFTELISKADNFEIYPIGDEKVKFAILFSGALTRLPQ